MILTALLIGAGIIGGIGIVASFWNDIVDWIKTSINTVKRLVTGIHYGVTVFVKNIGNAVKEIVYHYSKDGNQWYETMETRPIDTNKVPEHIRNRVRYDEEVDITEELENQLC